MIPVGARRRATIGTKHDGRTAHRPQQSLICGTHCADERRVKAALCGEHSNGPSLSINGTPTREPVGRGTNSHEACATTIRRPVRDSPVGRRVVFCATTLIKDMEKVASSLCQICTGGTYVQERATGKNVLPRTAGCPLQATFV